MCLHYTLKMNGKHCYFMMYFYCPVRISLLWGIFRGSWIAKQLLKMKTARWILKISSSKMVLNQYGVWNRHLILVEDLAWRKRSCYDSNSSVPEDTWTKVKSGKDKKKSRPIFVYVKMVFINYSIYSV